MNRGNDSPSSSVRPWLVFAALCSFLMWQLPGEETIPYHLAWIAIAVAYGIEAWPWGQAVAAVVGYTLVTGGDPHRARSAGGVIGWQETAEIPLMSALVLIVMWNVRRRHLAFATLAGVGGT